MKTCHKCGINKPETDFNKRAGYKSGLNNWCKVCTREVARKYYHKNKKKVYARNKAYEKTPRGKQVHKNCKFKYKYGITIEAHRLMYILQNGKCAICKQPTAYDKIHIDHDHKTGKVRGLLCHLCNLGLGSFKDNPKNLRNAARYLNERM